MLLPVLLQPLPPDCCVPIVEVPGQIATKASHMLKSSGLLCLTLHSFKHSFTLPDRDERQLLCKYAFSSGIMRRNIDMPMFPTRKDSTPSRRIKPNM